MVEQFGLAIMRSSAVRSFPLISGTTNFLVGSIRHADELSITVVPIAANFGAHSKEVPPPAEKIAISGASLTVSSMLLIAYGLPLYFISLPTFLAEATKYNSSN